MTSLLNTVRRTLGLDDETSLWAMTRTGYRTARVPKADGSKRLLSIPRSPLRLIQDVLAKQLTATLQVHPAAHGFVSGRSIATAAAAHASPAVLVNLDLADFYGHVTVKMLRAVLARYYTARDIDFIVHACFHRPSPPGLPQGAPTSPCLANAVAWSLDAKLANLAITNGEVWRYTRFVDDLTFSRSSRCGKADVTSLLRRVERVCWLEGFELVAAKRHVARPHQAQRVQGLVVNTHLAKRSVRLPREFHRKLRASLFNKSVGKADRLWDDDQLRGAVALVQMVEPERGAEYLAAFAAANAVMEGGG